ncbi:MAG TPA: class I SAM-dependent methyltransferase [Acidimicrobiales bacterium]|jgi:2-polyprenyl-3-methyl-5-hydroxy-6-metoxy-1,4-benzoquinol methylase|nr:class I SAM-dependent methyltransferase [Acidimicrobiales bacterium]
MQSHYHTTINPDDDNNSHALMLRMVGFNKRVLEAGCASGHVSELLNAQGCTVVGVENDASVVEPAMQWLERVIVRDLDDDALWDELDGELFDAILFGDVLEHLKDPLAALTHSVNHLGPAGVVVISVPNIAHADVKIALMKGTFPYTQSGLLDQTHIYFFTKDSLIDLVRKAGLVVTEVTRVIVPVFGTEIGASRDEVDDDVLEAVLKDRESETYQFVVKAVRDDGTRALEKLSMDVVELIDKLHDEVKRSESLENTVEELRKTAAALERQRDIDVQDLARLRHQNNMVKRLVPTPVRNLLRKRL